MAYTGPMDKPTIKLYHAPQTAFQDVLYGAEEEGIPIEAKQSDDADAASLAAQAAADSRLGVGIGVSGNTAALSHNKLPKDKPLFNAPLTAKPETLRALGANAARLVKQQPFITDR